MLLMGLGEVLRAERGGARVQAGAAPPPIGGWDGEVLGPFHLVPFLVPLEVSAQPREELTRLT